jgi:plasmid stability protein
MATITVRDLPDDVQRRLKQRAAANDRSMEAEARAILSAAVAVPGFGTAWLALAASYRGDEFLLPARSRDVDLS